MKYVLVFLLLTCALSASIKERLETAASENAQEETLRTEGFAQNETECKSRGRSWECDQWGCECI